MLTKKKGLHASRSTSLRVSNIYESVNIIVNILILGRESIFVLALVAVKQSEIENDQREDDMGQIYQQHSRHDKQWQR